MDSATAEVARDGAAVPLVEPWKQGPSLSGMSTKAAKRALVAKRRFNVDVGRILAEDVAQSILCVFYETPELMRVNSRNEFQVWAYSEALRIIARTQVLNRIEVSDEYQVHGGHAAATRNGNQIQSKSDWYQFRATVRPHQLVYCEAMDAIRMIALLPEEQQHQVWAVIESEDVVGYAKDRNVSLFDAMDALKHARVVMNRLADDLTDERKEAHYANAPVKAQWGKKPQ